MYKLYTAIAYSIDRFTNIPFHTCMLLLSWVVYAMTSQIIYHILPIVRMVVYVMGWNRKVCISEFNTSSGPKSWINARTRRKMHRKCVQPAPAQAYYLYQRESDETCWNNVKLQKRRKDHLTLSINFAPSWDGGVRRNSQRGAHARLSLDRAPGSQNKLSDHIVRSVIVFQNSYLTIVWKSSEWHLLGDGIVPPMIGKQSILPTFSLIFSSIFFIKPPLLFKANPPWRSCKCQKLL